MTKAVETMKETGKAGKEAPKEQPVKEEKPTDAPAKGKGKNSKKDEAAKLQEEINRKTKELEKCLADLERKRRFPASAPHSSTLWISWMKLPTI